MSQLAAYRTQRTWPVRLSRKEASDYLREMHGVHLSHSTLAKLAVIGGGPSFQKDGRFPRYTPPTLDAFAASRLGPERASTSDIGEPLAA